MFAQALAEYSLMTEIAGAVERGSYSVQNWFQTIGPSGYLYAGAALLLFLWLWGRRP